MYNEIYIIVYITEDVLDEIITCSSQKEIL
jgi:hypothetical protein